MTFVYDGIEIDGLITGLGVVIRKYVDIAATGNINLSTNLVGSTIDGISVVAGMRVFLKSQTTATENGIYLVINGAGASVRSDDYAAGTNVGSTEIVVQRGTTLADTGWLCTNDNASDVVGTNNLTYVQMMGYGANQLIDHSTVSINAGTGLSGGGDITATRTLNLNIPGLTTTSAVSAADYIPFYQVSGATQFRATLSDILAQTSNNKVITLTNTTNVTGITTTLVSIPWNTEVRKDARFTHSNVTNPENITINTAGWYAFSLNIVTDVSSGISRTITSVIPQINTGTGFNPMSATGRIYNRTTGAGAGSCDVSFIFQAAATNIVRVQVQTIAGSNIINTVATGTTLSIVSL